MQHPWKEWIPAPRIRAIFNCAKTPSTTEPEDPQTIRSADDSVRPWHAFGTAQRHTLIVHRQIENAHLSNALTNSANVRFRLRDVCATVYQLVSPIKTSPGSHGDVVLLDVDTATRWRGVRIATDLSDDGDGGSSTPVLD